MKNLLVEDPLIVGDIIELTSEEKKAIVNEALLGTRSLREILDEHEITEKEFYQWIEKFRKK